MAKMTRQTGGDAIELRVFLARLPIMPVHSPDAVDRAIVTRLQHDGRIANVDLADAIALSPSACLRRVRALEASGIIEGYRAEVSRSGPASDSPSSSA